MQSALLRAVEMLTAIPLQEGFQLADRAFDSSGPPPYAINLERALITGATDYIYIGFDKHHRLRFHVLFGSKATDHPHRWIRAGSLVWKNGSELEKFGRWGARWWQPNKLSAFADGVGRATKLMPQVIEFLDAGAAGPNIFVNPPA